MMIRILGCGIVVLGLLTGARAADTSILVDLLDFKYRSVSKKIGSKQKIGPPKCDKSKTPVVCAYPVGKVGFIEAMAPKTGKPITSAVLTILSPTNPDQRAAAETLIATFSPEASGNERQVFLESLIKTAISKRRSEGVLNGVKYSAKSDLIGFTLQATPG